MASKKDEQDTLKDKAITELTIEEEIKKKKAIEAEEAIEKNPDVEDPRLFSPLQEPDRPASNERCPEETPDSENPAG